VVKRRATRFSSTEYTIFTNYLDSHLWFEDAELQRWFEVWKRHYRSGPIKFELSAVVVIRRAWKKKAQEVKPWSNFMNGASKS
jgi:hypothetical protein